MSVGHHHEAVSQIVAGLASMMEGGDVDSELVSKVASATIQSQLERHAQIAGSVGAGETSCRITSVSVTCGFAREGGGGSGGSPRALYRQGPIASGPERRPPVAWGGGECFTVGSCTICYEYECSAG